MVCETRCANYHSTTNRLLSVKSLCLRACEDGSVINMQINQVTDKTIHRSNWRLLLGTDVVCGFDSEPVAPS